MAIFVSHPCWCGLVPWQLCGYGRSDRSTKLIRGLISETPAGFWSRRGLSYDDSAPVTPHNAPFPTYKAPRVHHATRRCRSWYYLIGWRYGSSRAPRCDSERFRSSPRNCRPFCGRL